MIFTLWLAFGIAALRFGVVAFHCSSLKYKNRAVLFLGESGTGKSTHSRLWLECIDGCELLNDDSPMLRLEGNKIYVYGSPWSGKTPCYKNEKHELKGIVRLSQKLENKIFRHNTIKAFAALFPSCPPAFSGEKALTDMECKIISEIISKYSVWHLEALPNHEAAELSFKSLF